jgi:hypothetical protein
MVVTVFTFGALLFVPGAGSNIHLAAGNGVNRFFALYVVPLFINGFLAGRQKIHGPEHIAVVCKGQVFHTQFLRPVRKALDANCRICKGKVRMDVKVSKIGHFFMIIGKNLPRKPDKRPIRVVGNKKFAIRVFF